MLILNSLFILGKERITIGNPDIGHSFYGREAFNFFSSFFPICSILNHMSTFLVGAINLIVLQTPIQPVCISFLIRSYRLHQYNSKVLEQNYFTVIKLDIQRNL